jgi:hypothetical protein
MTALSLFVGQSDIRAEETSPATTSDPKAAQVSVLIRRAIELTAAKKPAEADEAYRAALTAAERWEGAEGWNVAGILEWQAIFFRDQQRYDEAWAAAERGLLILKQKVGPYHSQTAKLAGLLASIAFWQKSPSKATPHLRTVMDAWAHRPSKDFEIVAANA